MSVLFIIMLILAISYYEYNEVNELVISSNSSSINKEYVSSNNKKNENYELEKQVYILPKQDNTSSLNHKNMVNIYIPTIENSVTPEVYQGDLNDFEQYEVFEINKDIQLKHNFVNASNDKIAFLTEYLQKAQIKGISQEQLQFAQKKINSLKLLNEHLQNELTIKQSLVM
ncbi:MULTISPECIES: hypothetical protein [unclassified Pseudoalteromonas]|uniref:hypothetical protein n=1 Tax=unclassified Pseudoalteromonas TaxID=194690 RepID=UPI0005A6B879|nr:MULTISPECIES: hypothetical protein [unclassified Pseudoalteromonas]